MIREKWSQTLHDGGEVMISTLEFPCQCVAYKDSTGNEPSLDCKKARKDYLPYVSALSSSRVSDRP
jgi:hypothetical protein